MADVPMPAANGAQSQSSSGPRQLPINLFTRDPSDSIPSSTYFLPANWRRFQLSELINKVLKSDSPIPFDFLINGEVLRTSLDAWVKKNQGGDEEGTIDVEYVRSVLPPEEVGRVEQEDWVSGLSLSRPGYILASSYLSHARILPLSGSSSSGLYTLALPTSLGATCATWVSPNSVTSDILLAAGGVDRAVHVFTIPSLEPDVAASEGSTGREIYTLMGHTGPISSISTNTSGTELVSTSWDGNVNLYSIPSKEPTEHQVAAEPTSYLPGQKKRRKINEERGPIEGLNDGEVGTAGWRRAPEGVMRGHKGRIGGVTWDKEDSSRVWTAGWDGSVRGWDVESGTGVVVRQGPSDKSALCIDQWAANGTLATGSMDRTVALWDTREATTVISLTLPTNSPVAALKCHTKSPFTLAAATYSGAIQIWDVRSSKNALFSAQKAGKAGEPRKPTDRGKVFGERLLALDWDGEVIVAGGEDGEVGVWKARGE